MSKTERDNYLSDLPMEDQIRVLEKKGFSKKQIRRLQYVREHQCELKYSEHTAQVRKLDFARWLYEQGKLKI